MGTESSVVVALREVRRLEIERQRREEEGRHRAQEHAQQEAHRRMTMEHARVSGAYPVQGHHPTGGWPAQQPGHAEGYDHGHGGPVRRTAEVLPFPGQPHGRHEMPAQPWDPAYRGGVAPAKSSSFTTFVFTFLICAGGAGAGYWKLDQDFQQKLSTLRIENHRLELARQDAIDATTKAQQDAKLHITALETKLVVTGAKAAAAEKASLETNLRETLPAQGTPVAAKPVTAKPASGRSADKASRSSSRSRRMLAKATIERGSAKASRTPTASKVEVAPEEKPFVAPKIRKKSMSDDPLGGLVLPAKAM
jgi:hypothetical protein